MARTKEYNELIKKLGEKKLIRIGKKAVELSLSNSEYVEDHYQILMDRLIEELTPKS